LPCYEYKCSKCDCLTEVFHSMSDESKHNCPECNNIMDKQVSRVRMAVKSGTLANHRENEHTKKVKDYERAVRSRKKAFGRDAVGDPLDTNDPRHVIKGKTLGGQQKEVDKGEFIHAAAKDNYMVAKAQEAIKKSKS